MLLDELARAVCFEHWTERRTEVQAEGAEVGTSGTVFSDEELEPLGFLGKRWMRHSHRMWEELGSPNKWRARQLNGKREVLAKP
ncbi:hypothetical protein PMIN01_01122 [Paraphaeosphaeria minitans]|uniref:Uncharacterized protein n=1 Tax=Paraphaeosphaeria minitans TaxID=565426 RepID=A0A9P6GUN8_9PLEO|nr:hypothetical protein PMIN01_01122 [Paraphaeosphaeria minitans]